MRKLLLFLITILLPLQIYSSNEPTIDIQKKIAKVEQLIIEAQNANGLWRDTIKIKSQAIEEYKNNNTEKALELLELAEKQAISGYQQAISQSDIEQLIPYYLKSDL